MERGSIIIFTLLILMAILAISTTLASVFLPKIKVFSETTNSVMAIYAADSISEWCLYKNRYGGSISQPAMTNGATFTIDPATCPQGGTLDHITVGTFRNVSRALRLEQAN